jgi:hypothetical protein
MNLTSLEKAKAWAGASSNTDDRMLERLIAQISQVILTYIQRPYILKRQYTERLNGRNQWRLMLRNYPVLSVDSLSISNRVIPASAFQLEPWDGLPPGRPQELSLDGYCFERGNANIAITYTAGFCVTDEPQTAGSNVVVSALDGSWARDEGVRRANGTPMQRVTDDPGAGQYKLGSAPGHYVFSEADAGAAVLISYSYVPHVLEQACCDLFLERYTYRDRPSQRSKTLNGQETVAFSLADMPDYTKTALSSFVRRVPL